MTRDKKILLVFAANMIMITALATWVGTLWMGELPATLVFLGFLVAFSLLQAWGLGQFQKEGGLHPANLGWANAIWFGLHLLVPLWVLVLMLSGLAATLLRVVR